jgi:hypothetical protein
MRIIIIVLIALFNTAFAQLPVDPATHLITFTGVIQANGTQAELYSRAREWFAKTYNSATDVIKMDDKDKIVGKANMIAYYKNYHFGNIFYQVSVYLKDGKFKYEITDFYHKGEFVNTGYSYTQTPDLGHCEDLMNSSKKRDQKIFEAFSKQINDEIEPLISSLKEAMNNQVATKDF